jgi:hypothetical protein
VHDDLLRCRADDDDVVIAGRMHFEERDHGAAARKFAAKRHQVPRAVSGRPPALA